MKPVNLQDFVGFCEDWGKSAYQNLGTLFENGFPLLDENLKNKPKTVRQPDRRLPDKPNSKLWDWFISRMPIINAIITWKDRVSAFFGLGSVLSQKFGSLLSSSFLSNNKGYEVPVFKEHQGCFDAQTIKEQEDEARVNFLYYLIRNVTGYSKEKVPDETEILTFGNYWEQTVLVWPEVLGDHSRGFKFLVGSTPLASHFSNLNDRSLNAYAGGVRGVFYEEVEIEPVEFEPFDRNQVLDDVASYANDDGLANKLRGLFNDYNDPPLSMLEFENSNVGKVKKISEKVGTDNFPVIVPTSFVNHTPEDMEVLRKHQIALLKKEKEATKDKKIQKLIDEELKKLEVPIPLYQELTDMPSIITWLARVLSEVQGAFPFEVMIEENDLISIETPPEKGSDEDTFELVRYATVEKHGKQVKQKFIKVPSLAEAISQLYLNDLENQQVNATQLRILTSLLMELTQTRQLGIKTYSLADTIRDWIGISTIDKTAKVGFTINPLIAKNEKGKQGLKDMLIPSIVDVAIEELDLNTEKNSLLAQLGFIEQGTTILKAVFTETIEDPSKTSRENSKWIKKIKQKAGKTDVDKKDMDTKLDQIEQGYTTVASVTEPDKIFGKPMEERPRLRRATRVNKENA